MTVLTRCAIPFPLLLSVLLAGCSGEPAESTAAQAPDAATTTSRHWVGTWGASPFRFQAFGPAPAPHRS